MGLTLDELKFIEKVLVTDVDWNVRSEAADLVAREIKLKTTDFVTLKKTDINGNQIDGD